MIAIKRVPLEDNLKEILKEIQHMNELHSHYTVEYKGSYLTNDILWVRKLKNSAVIFMRSVFKLASAAENSKTIILHFKLSNILIIFDV